MRDMAGGGRIVSNLAEAPDVAGEHWFFAAKMLDICIIKQNNTSAHLTSNRMPTDIAVELLAPIIPLLQIVSFRRALMVTSTEGIWSLDKNVTCMNTPGRRFASPVA